MLSAACKALLSFQVTGTAATTAPETRTNFRGVSRFPQAASRRRRVWRFCPSLIRSRARLLLRLPNSPRSSFSVEMYLRVAALLDCGWAATRKRSPRARPSCFDW